MSGSPENHATAPSIAVVANREKLRGRSEKRLRAALEDAGHGDAPWRWVEKGSAAKKAAKKAVRKTTAKAKTATARKTGAAKKPAAKKAAKKAVKKAAKKK